MAHDHFSHPFERLFAPQKIAIIGASERSPSVGRTIMSNMLAASFKGEIYPVNPKHTQIFGKKCYPSITSISAQIDLAVIATPAHTVPAIIADCVAAHVYSAIIISAGFKEAGAEGIELEEQVLFHSRGRLRIVGPNCLGVMRPASGLNATFAHSMALQGSVAFISQSGALCTAILDWSLQEKVGFSALISIGTMMDIGWSELLDYFNQDPLTKSIMIYMESLGDAHALISAAQRAALSKPVIILKAGRCEEAAQAAISHTGALSGNDERFSAAMRRCHVLRVDSVAELFNLANLLDKQPLPRGSRLTIITNAGGPGVIATDALISSGGQLTVLSPSTIQAYDAFLPSHGSQNPIDILGDASPEKFLRGVQIAVNEKTSDGTLIIVSPQDVTDPTQTAEILKPFSTTDTPILACWMGGESVAPGKELLNQARIPVFAYPEMAVQAFAFLGNYQRKIPSPQPMSKLVKPCDDQQAKKIFHQVRSEQRVILDEYESKKIIQAFGIQAVRTEIASSPQKALALAEEVGFPVVLKLYSHTITHKSQVNGVKLNLLNAQAVMRAFQEIESSMKESGHWQDFLGVTVQPMIAKEGYELFLGSMCDEQLGPIISFGLGGNLVELIKDQVIGFPPLSSLQAQNLLKESRIYSAFEKHTDQLERALIQFSHLIMQHPCIKECDINPLVITNNELIALDARIILHDARIEREKIPKPVFESID